MSIPLFFKFYITNQGSTTQVSTMDQIALSRTVSLEKVNLPRECPAVYRAVSDLLHPETYIINSEPALKILLAPWLVGARLAGLARESSIDFLRVVYRTIESFRTTCFKEIAEVVPLAGGLYYSMGEAFESLFGESINRCFIGARRRRTAMGWETELAYENFEALPNTPFVIIGDTIATGGTLERIIMALLNRSVMVRSIAIFSIAGGLLGAVRVAHLAERVDVPIYLFYSNAIFGVEDNGTDMPWLHPATITTPDTRERVLTAYGPVLGRNWCSIWDWGDRSKYPLKHLNLLLEHCREELKRFPSDPTKTILLHIQEEVLRSIARWHEPPSLPSSNGLRVDT